MAAPRSIVAFAGLILASLLPFPQPASAGGSWAHATVTAADLSGVSFVGEQLGWAVGAGGRIVKTTDGGSTWVQLTSGTTQNLNAVDFVDASRGWAVGAGSTVRATTNGGQTWAARSTGIDATLLDVDFADPSHGWAVGTTALLANIVLATTDGGVTWTPQAAPAGIGLVSVSFADERHGFAVGYADAAYRTDDGGQTWVPMAIAAETLEGNTTESFYTAVRMTPTEGLIAGFRGIIYRTEDGGLTWEAAGSLGKPVRGLAATADAAFAAGDAGAVARSQNRGETWTGEASGTPANLRAVAAASPGRAYAVGIQGTVATYREAGSPPLPLDVSFRPDTCGSLPAPWRHRVGGAMVSSVALDADRDGDTELIVAGSLGIRALTPFVSTSQATLWNRPFQSPIRWLRVAEIDGDEGAELVVGTGPDDPDRTGILALHAEDGSIAWSKRLPSGAASLRLADLDDDGLDDIAVVTESRDLRLLSGSDGDDLVDPRPLPAVPQDLALADLDPDGFPEAIVPMNDGRVLALDGKTQAVRWSYHSDGSLNTAETGDLTGDGIPDVIVGGTGMPGSVTPGRGDDQLNVGSVKGALVAALDGRDGTRLWDYSQNNPFMHFDAIALGDLTADGTPDVVAHAARLEGSHLLALDGKGRQVNGSGTGEPLPLWRHATSNGDPIQSVADPDSLDLTDGNGDGILDAFTAQWSGDVFAVSGRPPAPSPTSLAPPTADLLWRETRDWQAYEASPVRVDGRSFILTIFGDGLLSLRDPGTGSIEWSFDGGVFPHVTMADVDGDGRDEIGLGTGGGRVHALHGDGSPISDADVFLPERIVDVTAADGAVEGREEMIAASVDGTVAAVDVVRGEIRWDVKLSDVPRALAAGAGVVVVGASSGALMALVTATGEEAWTVPGTSSINDVVYLPDARLFAASNEAGSLRFIHPSGGVTGEAVSETWIGNLAPGDFDANGSEEVAAASGFSFRGYDTNGSELWLAPTSQAAGDVAAGNTDATAGDEVAGNAQGRAYGIRGSDGAALWDIAGQHVGGAAITDVNGDGDGDSIIGTHGIFTDGRIRVVDAGGSVLVDCRPGSLPNKMAVGDVDGDGAPEAAIAMREGDLYLVDGS